MTFPRLSEAGTELERELLSSARLDVGRQDGLKRTLLALGVGAGAISTSTSTAAAGVVAGGGAAAAGGSALVGGAGVGMVVKWVAIAAVVGGGAALSAAPVVRHIRATTAPAAVAARAPKPVADSRTAAEPVPDRTSVPPALAASAPASRIPVLSLGARPAYVGAPSPVLLQRRSTLPAELSMLDRVRASLAARDTAAALGQLDAYDRAFPSSVMADEALVLRVDALIAHGDRAGAAALGRQFLAGHPASPHAPHLLHVLGANNRDRFGPIAE